MSDHNVLIWIDEREAKVFHIDRDEFDSASVRSAHPDRHMHREAKPKKGSTPPLDKVFFKRVAEALGEPGEILITGPAQTKTNLAEFLGRSWPSLAARITGVERLDRPSNHALVLFARYGFQSPAHPR